jgi:hypothetical protein
VPLGLVVSRAVCRLLSRHRAERLIAVMDRELAMADTVIARANRQLQQASPRANARQN